MEDYVNNKTVSLALIVVLGILAAIIVPVYLVTTANTERMKRCTAVNGSWVQNANKKFECRTGAIR